MTIPAAESYRQAAAILRASRHNVAFTGAGISVESGIPPFRGEEGLWARHDPVFLDIDYFYEHPLESWKKIREIFYDFFGKAAPNEAHRQLADLERRGLLHSIITQNIDNLHQEAGSRLVIEFHGTSQALVCTRCGAAVRTGSVDMNMLPPRCSKCNGILKPDFPFFGEPIAKAAHDRSLAEVERAGALLVIGTTGEIMPASVFPMIAKSRGAKVVEINVEESKYTHTVTDVFLRDRATVAMRTLRDLLCPGEVP